MTVLLVNNGRIFELKQQIWYTYVVSIKGKSAIKRVRIYFSFKLSIILHCKNKDNALHVLLVQQKSTWSHFISRSNSWWYWWCSNSSISEFTQVKIALIKPIWNICNICPNSVMRDDVVSIHTGTGFLKFSYLWKI